MSLLLLLVYAVKLIFVSIVLALKIIYERLSKIISTTLPNTEYERDRESRDD